jgi:SAM-dependent methyltransferase
MSSCHLCGSSELLLLVDFGKHPVSKHYLAARSEDKPVWPVKLYFCESCGLTQLVGSCPAEFLYDDYVTLSSWKPQPHVRHEIDILAKYSSIDLTAKIVEIGCNDGLFLQELALIGYENLIGIEPSADAHALAVSKGFDVVKEFLSPELSEQLTKKRGQFDLVISRQNFEHIGDLQGVTRSLDVLLKPNGYVLIELPNFECNLRCLDYSLWEEHVNYFTIETLKHFLSLSNIKIIYEEVFLFSGEGIFVIGQKTDHVEPSLDYLPELKQKNLEFANFWPVFRSRAIEYLTSEHKKGKKIAVYGAGARAFCLISFAGLAPYIDVILDDQPEKQEKFMPGGRVPVKSSDLLYSQQIDICLLAVNAENEDRVINRHAKWVQQGGEFWSVFPPSDRLLPLWDFGNNKDVNHE